MTAPCMHPPKSVAQYANRVGIEIWWCTECGALHDSSDETSPWRLPSKPAVIDVADDLRQRVFDAIHLLDLQVADLARLRGPLTGVERARVEAVIASINRAIKILDPSS